MATAEFSKFAGILSAALSQLQGTSTKDTGFPRSSVGKESACNSGDPSSIPGLGRSVGEGNGNPLKYSCLENPMDRGAWQATVHEVTRKKKTVKNTNTWRLNNTFLNNEQVTEESRARHPRM